MSDQVSWLVELAVKPGQLEKFRALTSEMVKSAEDESGVLIYERFVSRGGRIIYAYERYVNSAAALAHLRKFEAQFSERFARMVSRKRFTVFGAPTEELKRVLNRFGATYLRLFGEPTVSFGSHVELRPPTQASPTTPTAHAMHGPTTTARPPRFDRYIGIDYSGAQTPTSALSGLRVYIADRASPPLEVTPPPSPRKHWTRRGVAEWVAERVAEDRPTLIGIDHAFSFPHQYFDTHNLPLDWPVFLDDFQQHWPTHEDHMYIDFIRDGVHGNATARSGDPRWRRLTELRTRAKSVFQFDVQGSVAKSTHAGLPWLRYLRGRAAGRLHFWPFDGWDIPIARSAVVEVYPALWGRGFPTGGRTSHQQDAYSVAAWMQQADRNGSLTEFFNPSLEPAHQAIAQIEGWILGVT